MFENNTLKFVVYDEDCNDYDSDGLEIDETQFESSPEISPKKKFGMDPKDKELLENLEEEIERQLDEKAARSKLSVKNVKNILKNVITNEHVFAMVRRTVEDNASQDDDFRFEPRLTRAKAKELFKMQPNACMWPANRKQSEVRVFINQELPEDSSDEEYVPDEEETDEDVDLSMSSDVDSQPATPATPSSICSTDCATQTVWSKDGLFKVPKITERIPNQSVQQENIALRTRSKLSLSDTPLESIEQAFIPPDITTDMYDFNCDDEHWNNFINGLNRPLYQDAMAVVEDDEDDPDFNVLADEELDEDDKEELRVDSRVKITKKEMNSLIAELSECLDFFTPSYPIETSTDLSKLNPVQNEIQQNSDPQVATLNLTIEANTRECDRPTNEEKLIRTDQLLLLKQQFRQHVQLLTQHFLQTSINPEYTDISKQLKEKLISLKRSSETKNNEYLNPVNLVPAIDLVEKWENKIKSNDSDVQETKTFVENELKKHFNVKRNGKVHSGNFAPFLMQTILESNVFLYPSLLPHVSLRPVKSFPTRKEYLYSENCLIALGIEQFTEYMESNKDKFKLYRGKAPLKDVTHLIVRYMMPMKDPYNLYKYIMSQKLCKVSENPIHYYCQYKKTIPFIHYVIQVNEENLVPLIEHPIELFPQKWKDAYVNYKLYGKTDTVSVKRNYKKTSPLKRIAKPPAFNRKRRKIFTIKQWPNNVCDLNDTSDLSHVYFNNYNKPKRNRKNINKSPRLVVLSETLKNQVVLSNAQRTPPNKTTDSTNLRIVSITKNAPSMQFLTTPIKNIAGRGLSPERILPDLGDMSSSDDGNVESTVSENDLDNASSLENTEKDNEDEITALMLASSTIKNKVVTKKNITATEKKKIKQQKEHEATLALLMPDDVVTQEEKATKYAQAYFDKVQERLSSDSPDEYNEFLATLSDFDESVDSVSNLYTKVENLLSPNNHDLCEEFLTFLTPTQAKQIGKLVPHFMYTNMAIFLRKLEVYFNKQPAQIRKIYNLLAEFGTAKSPAMEKIKSCILPLLKGNTVLIDYFLQIFPKEKPPENLMTVWENIDCDKADGNEDEDTFETINVPATEDPYGNASCICSCHDSTDEQYNKKTLHCLTCGTKFIQGRVFIQTKKGLRPAGITFDSGSMTEHRKRLCVNPTGRSKRRYEASSPTKSGPISPNKQMHIESEEDDGTLMNRTKSPSKTARTKSRVQTAKKVPSKIKVDRALKSDTQKKLNEPSLESGKQNVLSTTESTSTTQKRASPRFQPHNNLNTAQETVVNSELSPSKNDLSSPPHSSKEITIVLQNSEKKSQNSGKGMAASICQNESETHSNGTVFNLVTDSVLTASDLNKNCTGSVENSNKETLTDLPHNVLKEKKSTTQKSTLPAVIKEDGCEKENAMKVKTAETSDVKTENEQEAMDTQEWDDCNASIESTELKLSPGHSIESIDVCEESSQDTSVCQDESHMICSESENESNIEVESNHSDCSSPIQIHSEESSNNDIPVPGYSEDNKNVDGNSGNIVNSGSWTREEDKIILQTFQQHCGSEKIFEKINLLIPQRTVREIRERFQTLMQLLQQITDSNT